MHIPANSFSPCPTGPLAHCSTHKLTSCSTSNILKIRWLSSLHSFSFCPTGPLAHLQSYFIHHMYFFIILCQSSVHSFSPCLTYNHISYSTSNIFTILHQSSFHSLSSCPTVPLAHVQSYFIQYKYYFIIPVSYTHLTLPTIYSV